MTRDGLLHPSRARLTLLYVLAVLPCVPDLPPADQTAAFSPPAKYMALRGFLGELIKQIGLEESGWKASHVPMLVEAVRGLCAYGPEVQDAVLTQCAETAVHVSAQTRALLANLYLSLVPELEAAVLSRRVLPPLLTLSNDPEPTVRLAAVKGLGALAASAADDSTLERLNAQLELLIEEEHWPIWKELARIFSHILPHTKPRFRNLYLLPKLARLCGIEGKYRMVPDSEKTAFLYVLFDAFKQLRNLPREAAACKAGMVGLKLLQQSPLFTDNEAKAQVASLLQDMEAGAGGATTVAPVAAAQAATAPGTTPPSAIKATLMNYWGKFSTKSTSEGGGAGGPAPGTTPP
jgi:hypothetical protein